MMDRLSKFNSFLTEDKQTMKWTERYADRIGDVRTALYDIRPGERIAFSHASSTPQLCAQKIVEFREHFSQNEIFHMLCLGELEYMNREMEGHVRHVTNFVAANSRQAVEEGRADFIPLFFHEVPKMIRRGDLKIDVAIIQVSEPDEEGYCSFGLSCDYTKPAAESARLVIAEVNSQMPRVGGDNKIHISKIHHLIPVDYPIYTIPQPKIGEVEQAIGGHCATLIQDGDTLQLGIGAIPDAVLLFLGEKKHLGIHTEMFSDGILNLVKRGVVDGSRKTLHPGKMVATFLMGSEELYRFVDNNPDVELYPVDYVNDPQVIAQNDHMISINSAIEIDLMGQVVSESIGDRQFSGVGGQVDYVRGANLSRGGKSIIALPSTARGGKSSRIVPQIAMGAAVTTSRNDVDYVVTEYGVAHLKGKSLRERAESLIAIAHPDFRDELRAFYNNKYQH